MGLALQVLDGVQKGKVISLRDGFIFSTDYYRDPEMSEKHAEIKLDSNFFWKINALGDNTIRAGLVESASFSLIAGFVFHLGQTGFKAIEKKPGQSIIWQDQVVDYLKAQTWRPKQTELFFFLYPVRLTFLQGPQTDEFYTVSYGPREMGFNNLDLNLIDPEAPAKVVKFFQVGETAYIENLCGDKALINGEKFHQHALFSGDKLTFSSYTIELSILR